MSIVLITGDHPRHIYFGNKLVSESDVSHWIIESRESFIEPYSNVSSNELMELEALHFKKRLDTETMFFGDPDNIKFKHITRVKQKELNGNKVLDILLKTNPKLVISYGCHKLGRKVRKITNSSFWNVHGGISPEYRGVITHFWPSYNLEPQMTGMTLHETTDFLDAGNIIFQTAAPMVRGDSLHMLAARNVDVFVNELSQNMKNIDIQSLPVGTQQKSYGRVYLAKDWRAEHLKMIYQVYNDKIVDYVLDGQITGRVPTLVNNFQKAD